MDRATETRAKPRALAILAVTSALLAGCDEALSTDKVSDDAAPETSVDDSKVELFPETQGNSRADVEAPDAFQLTEAGLWDGRPSLGGIWVAHPDVTQPERVKIRNAANNKSVTGALFRRERNLPGPALQLSSEAAAELGILAGAPTKVEVVALRRKPAEPEPTATEDAAGATDAHTADASADGTSTETEQPAKRKWWQKKAPATAAAGVAAAGTVGADTAGASIDAAEATGDAAAQAATPTSDAVATEPQTDQPAKRKWWQKKEPAAAAAATAGATAAADAETAEDAVESAAQAAPAAVLADPELTAPEEKPAKRKWWQKKDPEAITETPLDPIAGAAAAIDAADPTPASTPSTTDIGGLAKPYVQVGTFGVEANADSAAAKIRRNGLPAEVRQLQTDDKVVWRVLVGPATSKGQRNALQSDVKDLGFKDAFLVKN